jgi:hypothetical protein
MKTLKRGLLGGVGASAAGLILSVGLILAGSQAAWAKHHVSSDDITPTSVTGCGTLSGNGQIYLVTQNITQTGIQLGSCIVLSGHDNTLDLQGFNISFTGIFTLGAGVRVTGAENVIEGSNGTISGFVEGILDTGGNTAGDGVNVTGNSVGLELAGGGESTEIWTNFSADSNSDQGVFIQNCGDECSVSDFDASGNSEDGVLVTGSTGARISVFTADGNGGDGVHIGSSSGSGNTESRVWDAPIGFPSGAAVTANLGDGIFLDASESSAQDQVVFNFVEGNSGIDLHDATTTCGNNHWVHNDFGTGTAQAGSTPNPACIPNTGI